MSEAATEAIVVAEVNQRVKWIRFNRPHVKNAIGPESADLVRDEVKKAGDDGARVVVISGSGGSFCAGADLKALAPRMGEFTGVRDVLVNHYHPLVEAMTQCPLPVIAAVDGAAAGIGCDIALAADMRLASERAFFAQNFVNIGLIPDGGGTFTLPRLIGLGRALEMATSGARIQAEQASAWGLVNHVFAVDEFETRVQEFAATLAAKAPLSMARSKGAMRAATSGTLEEALTREADMQQELFVTSDFQEGVSAFLEKRPPNFEGR